MRFVTRRDNVLSVRVVSELERKGHRVQFLAEGREAPRGTLALFDLKAGSDDKGRCRTNLRFASHRLLDDPVWTRQAVYVVGVRKLPENVGRLEESLDRLVRLSQIDPTAMDLLRQAPWGAVPTDEANWQLYRQWMRERVGIVETAMAVSR